MPVTPTHLKGRNLGYLSGQKRQTNIKFDRRTERMARQGDREIDKQTGNTDHTFKMKKSERDTAAEQTTGKEVISEVRKS